MKLNTTLFAAVILILTACTAYSQTSIAIGPEFGLNLANVSTTPSSTTDTRTGFIIGGLVDINIGQTIGVTGGVRFIMKGWSSTQGTLVSKIKLNYFEIPILLKARFPLTEVKPYVLAGPTLAFNLAATSDQTNGQQSATTDVSNFVESMDFGLLFGAGSDFKIATKTSLFIQFAYSLGLSNIAKNQPSVTIKNYGIQITAGAKFNM